MAVGLSLGVFVKHFAKNEIKSTDLQITKNIVTLELKNVFNTCNSNTNEQF